MFKFFAVFIFLILPFSCSRASSGPLRIPLPVEPSFMQPDGESVMDVTKLTAYVPYKVSCNLQTGTDNDILYLIRHFMMGDVSYAAIIDGNLREEDNTAVIPSAGAHSLSFSVKIQNVDYPAKDITFHNASDGVMLLTNCFAMVGY